MKFNPKGLLVTAAGVLVPWVALTTHSVAVVDSLGLIALAAFVAVASAAIVVGKIQGRPVIGQAGAFREVLRWLSNL